jgi:para-aminobenzoate synthetase
MSAASIRRSVVDLEEFCRAHALGVEQLEDLAPALFSRLSAEFPAAPAALLDSSDHAQTQQPARSAQSILAFSLGEHASTVSHSAGTTTVRSAALTRSTQQPFFSWLSENWGVEPWADPAVTEAGDTPRFALGWVGWLGYELHREAGTDSAAPADRGGLPEEDAALFRATHAVVLHHQRSQLELQWVESEPENDSGSEADTAWPRLVQEALIRTVEEHTDAAPTLRFRAAELTVRDSREQYLCAIAEAKRQISEGNSYEICLTTAVTGTLMSETGCSGVGLFRALRARNRAPFTQFLRIGETEILSTSPERFLSISESGTVRSEPIKGTRGRGESAEEDRERIQDLRTHPKDRAENVMIADLVRNDLSIHAIPGSLRTERLCAVETYPTVHQLVSTISARIEASTDRAEVVAAAFPPGSMTGAPKISTMNILARLESGARGPYSGVAGYFSSNGAADLSVLIRTAVLTGPAQARNLHLGLGGAITADSDPAEEWDEIRIKSRGVLDVLDAAFPEPQSQEALSARGS